MIKKLSFLGLMVAGLALGSCQETLNEESLNAIDARSKIVHTRSGASATSLLVKFSSEPSEAQIQMLAGTGVKSFEKVFPSVPGKEELEKRFGLDKWYSVTIEEGRDIEAVALELASDKRISTVEYDIYMEPACDRVSYPYEGQEAATRASMSDLGFNDPLLIDQWNYYNLGDKSVATSAYEGGDINVKDTWNTLTAGDPSIIVAVVDEGVAYSHPDLAPNMWVNEAERSGTAGKDDDGNGYVDDIYGYNFVDGTAEINFDETDYDTGHGTHCAGVISAVNNNGIGVSGVAGGSGKNDGTKIMTCQIFSGNGGGLQTMISKAIKYAADNGASIISCSFGQPGSGFLGDANYTQRNAMEVDAIRYFEATKNNDIVDGGIVIFATGNEAAPYASYPGALNDIVSVSAFGPDYLPTHYTNYGPGCNVVAPGGEAYLPPWTSYKGMILSTLPLKIEPSGYGYMQGTSMACPHVSGIAALGLAYAKKLGKKYTLQEFKNMLISSANDFDSRLNGSKSYYNKIKPDLNLGKFMKKMGTGSIDTWIFMMKIEGVPCLIAETGRNQWIDVSDYFGTSSVNLTYLSVEVSEEDKAALGLAEDPYMQYGRLYIHPTKMGAGKITVRAVGGGEIVGGADNVGGMEMTQEISIISRSFKSSNGGWL
ncbi:MAG: S8 family serine peptidase [Bacteroidales bacterium]|nr:S8 family serine peptidase [Bacteroidales bacterium]